MSQVVSRDWKVDAGQLEVPVDADQFGFSTTDELEPLDSIVGQPRALKALDLGLAVEHPSYNIYVAGASGMGKKGMIQRALAERVEKAPTPPDWIYVHNFDDPHRPLAISLSSGQGLALKKDMEELVERLREELPQVRQRDDLRREQQQLRSQLQEKTQEMSRDVEKRAREEGLTVQQLSGGQFALVPLRDGEPMDPKEIEKLSEEERQDIAERQRKVAESLSDFMAKQAETERSVRSQAKEIEKDYVRRHVEPMTSKIAERYGDDKLADWLNKLTDHVVQHLDRFQSAEEAEQQEQVAQMVPMARAPGESQFHEYQVNLLVDHSQTRGAPVIVENSPNYKNLFGIIEQISDQLGRAQAKFTDITAGSLLRASGGYLIFNLRDALLEPVVWKELKRAIQSQSLQIEVYEPLGLFSVSALKPEPIPLDVKLVVVGDPLLYHLLLMLDEDFREIFKVKAEFDPEMGRDKEAGVHVGRLVQKLRRQEKQLRAFDAGGVAELVRAGARIVSDQEKMTTEFSRLADLIREASYWASKDDSTNVSAEYVQQAITERLYRSDLVAAKIRELITQGALRIDVDQSVVAQVNGLSVAQLGDYAFARPSRVTASVGPGLDGIVNIERESKLSGRVHDKGMLILEGYMRGQYASEEVVAFSANLAMEQSYGVVDGDSASITELICLLSALAGVPLRQDIALTGSVNQWGQVQAVGGVNEKVEGFFDVCRELALTGQQAVCVPSANRRNLVVRQDVVDAIREEKFHVWAVDHVDQAIELLTGMPAGSRDDEESFHGRVAQRLRHLGSQLREQPIAPPRHYAALVGNGRRPSDPRPPLPGN